jgi:hypothetical protein
MLKERKKGKNIAEEIKNKIKTSHLVLIPNYSVGNFIIGNHISEYLFCGYKFYPKTNEYSDDLYEFDDPKLSIWVDDNNCILFIGCNKECYWQGKNLIKMPFEQFLINYKVVPDKFEMIYTLVSENRGQNQMVYDFDTLGLQIWVWKKKIVTVLISNYLLDSKE